MAETIGRIEIELKAQMAKFESDMGRAARIMQRDVANAAKSAEKAMEAAARSQEASSRRLAQSVSKDFERLKRDAGQAARAVVGLFAVNIGAGMVRDLARVADSYANVQGKLRLVTADQQQLGRVSSEVFAISQRTYTSLDATATLVARTTRALISNGAEAGTALSKSLKLTEALNNAFLVSGATATESENALIQLAQGMAAGALRGEELNAVAEQGPRIMQALAEHLGVTTGELRALAKQGRLTTDVITDALLASFEKLQAEAESMPLTIQRAMTNLSSAFQKFVGEADQASGASRDVAEAIQSISRNLPEIVGGLMLVAKAAALWFATYRVGIPLILATSAAVKKATADIIAMNAAHASGTKLAGAWGARLFAAVGGWPLLAVAAAGAIYAMWESIEAGEAKIRAPITAIEDLNEAMRRQVELRNEVTSGRAADTAQAEQVKAIDELIARTQMLAERVQSLQESHEKHRVSARNVRQATEELSEASQALGDHFALLIQSGQEIPAAYNAQAAAAERYGVAVGNAAIAVAALLTAGKQVADEPVDLLRQIEVTQGLDAETLALVETMERQAETFGMTTSQLTMYEAQMKAAKATTAEGAEEILKAAGALASLQRAQERETAATKASTIAKRAQATVERELAKHRKELMQADGSKLATSAQFLKETQMLAAELEGPMAVAMRDYAEAVENVNELQKDEAVTAAEAAARIALLGKEFDQTAAEIAANTEEAQWLQAILDDFNNTSFAGLRAEIAKVGEALKTATDPKVIAALEERMGSLRQTQLEGMVGASQAALRSMQNMTEEGSKSYKKMELAIQALNIVQGIAAIVNQGMGDPYTAIPRMIAMAAMVGQLVDGINSMSGSSAISAAERQAAQGTGTVLGDAEAQSESIVNAAEITADATTALVGINRGMLRALTALQDSIGSATNMLARGSDQGFSALPADGTFGQAIAPLLDPVGINFLGLNNHLADPLNLLGGSSEITDQGIVIVGDLIEGIMLGAYQQVESRRWRWGSRHTSEEIVDVSGDLQAQFQLIIDSLVDTVREGALALGMLPADIEVALEAFKLEEIRISLMDLSGEEQQAELLAVFSSIFDGLAGAVVPYISQFQQVGEGLGETLIRVATGVQVTQEALDRLGFALDETDPETFAQISEGLIGLVGGIEAFIEGMASFVDKFAPESHKFALLQSDLTTALSDVGLAVPATRDGMWELMQSLDATTEAGRNQIATLLRLAGVADAYYSTLEEGAKTAADILAGIRFDVALEGMTAFDRAVFDTNQHFSSLRQEMVDLGATAAELAQLELLHAEALGRVLAQEAAANAAREAAAIADAAAAAMERADAATSYAEAVGAINDELMELGGASEFQMSLRDIAIQWQTNVDQLNELAQAAGLAGAREEDLGRAMALATMQRMKAIAALEAEGRALVESLGFGPLGLLDAEIAALEERESAATSAIASFGDAMGEAANAASEAINLLLGDLSPLRDRQKLDIALEALKAGQIGQEDVLQIGRRLFASGADYNRLFAQVTAIGDRRMSGGSDSNPITQGVSAAMQQLLDEREAILAQQTAAARFGQASDLAQVIADLAGARGESFEDVARSLGLTGLDQLMSDLRLDSMDGLTDYLTALQADSYGLEDLRSMITAGEQGIIDTLIDIFGTDPSARMWIPIAGDKPGFRPPVSLDYPQFDPIDDDKPGFRVPSEPIGPIFGKSADDQHSELLAEIRTLNARLEAVERNTARSADATEDTAGSTAGTEQRLAEIASNQRSAEVHEMAYRPRSTRGLPA